MKTVQLLYSLIKMTSLLTCAMCHVSIGILYRFHLIHYTKFVLIKSFKLVEGTSQNLGIVSRIE